MYISLLEVCQAYLVGVEGPDQRLGGQGQFHDMDDLVLP